MKKHIFIWVFGLLSLIASLTANNLLAHPQVGVTIFSRPNTWYVVWGIFQLIMCYGSWLLLQAKNRSKYFIILPLFSGLLGAIIVYFIPKKEGNFLSTN
jgi:hypothetical protein